MHTHGGGGGTDPPDDEERLRLSRHVLSDHWYPSSIPPSFSRRHITWHDDSVGAVAHADGVQRAVVYDACARGFAQLGGGQWAVSDEQAARPSGHSIGGPEI